MNCDLLPLMLNAALDGELSPHERADVDQHLLECAACRDQWNDLQGLHLDLTTVLAPPAVEPAVRQVMATLQPKFERRTVIKRGPAGSRLVIVAVACTLLLTMGICFQSPPLAQAVAEISMTTGPIDYKAAEAKDWIAIEGKQRIALPAFARVRTRSKSLCEIRTGTDAVVRLNCETELVLHRAEKVELVAGELWCRAPATTELEICGSSARPQTANINVFMCPSATEMQWKALPNHTLSCQDVAKTPVELQSPLASCTLEPGQSVTFAEGKPVSEATHISPLDATSWQLPLLVLRSPQDSELRSHLTNLLAMIGETKASYLYESQIRELGPAGVVPLIAYVQSPDSQSRPRLRHRAMELISEMATSSSIADLDLLLKDQDPVIRQLATTTLARLQPDRLRPAIEKL